MTAYIYSTLSSDVNYTSFHKSDIGDLITPEKSVFIKGGAHVRVYENIITPIGTIRQGDTPEGAVTQVSDEDLMFLEQNPVFNLHRDNGFIRIDKKNIEIEKAVKDLNSQDGSRQRKPSDMPAKEQDKK